jgi:hypothetical protein
MNPPAQDLPTAPGPSEANRGCATRFVFGALTFGVLALVALAEIFSWITDESHYLGYFRMSGVARVGLILVISMVILAPLALLANRWRAPLQKAVFRSWAYAAGFTLLLSVARLPGLTAPINTLVLQMLLELVYLLFIVRSTQPARKPAKKSMPALAFALFAAGLMALPWVLVGALGSVALTLLTLIDGLLFGAIAARILEGVLFQPIAQAERRPGQAFLFTGVTGMVALLIMVVGLQTSGLQWYLLLPIPLLSFSAYAMFLTRQPAPDVNAVENGSVAPLIDQPGSRDWLANTLMIGVSAAAALAFVDAKELSIVVGSGAGEILQWVGYAAWASLGISLLLGIVGYLAMRRSRGVLQGISVKLAAGAVWLGAAAFFALAGRSAFYGDRLFVILRSQADVSSAASMTDYDQRREYVYKTLVSQAESSQASLRKQLDQFHIGYTPYYLVNGIEVRGGPLVRLWLQGRPEVDRVLSNPILRPLPKNVPASTGTDKAPSGVLWNQSLIGADKVWNELHVTGQGVVVGQSDSGVQGDHPELAESYRGRAGGDAYNWLDPWNHFASPTDIGGHGTHTLGIILGKHTGIAPGATWFACVNEARNMGNPADYLNCMQYMLAPYPQGGDPFKDGDPTRSANVLNNSWGCPDLEGCDPGALRAGVNALRAAGIFVVASAGNAGEAGCGSVTDPLAIYPGVTSVGAIDSKGNLSIFSSIGPVSVDGSQRLKPDIVAPGENVLSSFPGSTYQLESGTSMSGPHVVGVVALMWSANPSLIGNIDRTEQILEQTAQPYKGIIPACVKADQRPNNAIGWGTVDAFAAVKMALAEKK